MRYHRDRKPARGRGSVISPNPRFAAHVRESIDDGWRFEDEDDPSVRTTVHPDRGRSALVYNTSPDVPFDRSVNPYRGCEHGCVYCFARPSHAWLGLSPGLDFETQIFHKRDLGQILSRELGAKNYRCQPLALGVNTDAYQPVERRLRATRSLLEVLRDAQHPVSLITKSSLIERDLDLLSAMAKSGLVHVAVSQTTLDKHLARTMEPRAASPQRRLDTIRALNNAGIPVSVLIAPLIPGLTDHELESILNASRAAGAQDAGYVMLRLPHELNDMFSAWLEQHYPDKAKRVLNMLKSMHSGSIYDASFGTRMRGSGPLADLLAQRFALAYRKLGFRQSPPLNCTLFRPPPPHGQRRLL